MRRRRAIGRVGCLATLLVLCAHPGQTRDASVAPSSRPTACEKASRDLFGAPPTPIAGEVKEPKKLHHVNPKYPQLPSGTVGSGVWFREALIGPDGRVRNVSVLRDLKFEPPYPQFSDAITDAINEWRFAPTTVGGTPVPVCMRVSVTVDWK